MVNFPPILKSSSLGMKCPLQKTLEKSCMTLVQNIGIPAYSKITAHKFVKVKFLDYTCDMSKRPNFVQQMPCYKLIQTSET
jgi:hypothetical protein